jgi:catechol 2,3-dioxygenase-like lactoylglutathione lyase family enzyme
MQVALNHTIVPATDKRRSADFLAGVLGVDAGQQWGPFVPVALSNEVTLDYMDARDFDEHHYAFIVAEADFDPIFERIKASGTRYYADPHRAQPSTINHGYGGRGVYFDDPDGHLMEVITQPYS